jgi:hypothetical protein
MTDALMPVFRRNRTHAAPDEKGAPDEKNHPMLRSGKRQRADVCCPTGFVI